MKNRVRARWIPALLIGLGLISGLIWWRGDVTSLMPRSTVHDASRTLPSDAGSRQQPHPDRGSRFPGQLRADTPATPEERLAARCSEEWTQSLRDLSARLQPTASPDAAIAHALLNIARPTQARIANPWASGRELQEAQRRWPGDLDVAWHNARNCNEKFGCDRRLALRHLASLDPDNAAVWVLAMQDASLQGDDAGLGQALQRAAAARFYDGRYGTTYLLLRPLLDDLPPPSPRCMAQAVFADLGRELGHPPGPSDLADSLASSLELASGLPAYSPLSKACKPSGQALPPGRSQQCMSLLSKIADGDTLIDRSIALSLLVQLAGDGPDGPALRERYRRLRWLFAQMMQPGERPADPIRKMWSMGEARMWEEFLQQQGRWPPPPGWLPENPRQRALILTGRLPPDHP